MRVPACGRSGGSEVTCRRGATSWSAPRRSRGVDRAPVLKGLGTIAFRQGDLEAAEQAFAGRYELVQAGGDRAALAELGYEAADGLDDADAIRLPLHMRAAAARMEGSYDEARALYLRSIELNESLGNELDVVGENHNLVYVELHSGGVAERRFRTSSEWIFAHDNAYLRPYSFLDAGVLALHDGDVDRACRLVACAQRIFEETDSIPDPDDYVELESATAQLKERLGDRFATVWDEGRRLGIEQAVALAREPSTA